MPYRSNARVVLEVDLLADIAVARKRHVVRCLLGIGGMLFALSAAVFVLQRAHARSSPAFLVMTSAPAETSRPVVEEDEDRCRNIVPGGECDPFAEPFASFRPEGYVALDGAWKYVDYQMPLGVGDLRGEDEPVPLNVVRRTLASKKGLIFSCFRDALIRAPDTSGELDMGFTILPNGATAVREIIGKPSDGALHACIVRSLEGVSFPAPGAHQEVVVPMVLSSSKRGSL